ncbi:unnamed protein product [Withania somnifera]
MGILDELRSVAGKLLNQKIQNKSSYAAGIKPAVSKIDRPVQHESGQKTNEIGRILSKLSKFAIVSAVGQSLKTYAGGSKIMKEGLKDQSPSQPSSRAGRQDVTVVMEEMQAKMEKLQDDMNNTKLQNEVSTNCITGLESFEFSDEPIKSSTPSKANRKKIFIRSRL